MEKTNSFFIKIFVKECFFSADHITIFSVVITMNTRQDKLAGRVVQQ